MFEKSMISAVKVQFKNSIDEDSFVERGMLAWLTFVEFDEKEQTLCLYFDFEEFEDYNKKYFRRVYHQNNVTQKLFPERSAKSAKFTAVEAGYYEPKISCTISLDGEQTAQIKNTPFYFDFLMRQYLVQIEN